MTKRALNPNARKAFEEYKMEVANELSISDKSNLGNNKKRSISDTRDRNSVSDRMNKDDSNEINQIDKY